MRIVETGNAKFIENGEISGSDNLRNVNVELGYKLHYL